MAGADDGDPDFGSELDEEPPPEHAGCEWARQVLGDSLSYNGAISSTSGVTKLPTQSVFDGGLKLLLLYFSGRWCPLCVETDKMLRDVYSALKSLPESGELELVFASCDVSESAFYEHFEAIGSQILAVPWNRDMVDELPDRFEVTGLPTLLVVDFHACTVLSRHGREDLLEARRFGGTATQAHFVHSKWMDLWHGAHGTPCVKRRLSAFESAIAATASTKESPRRSSMSIDVTGESPSSRKSTIRRRNSANLGTDRTPSRPEGRPGLRRASTSMSVG